MAQKRLVKPEVLQRIRADKVLKEKHKFKRPSEITDQDVLEWARFKMLDEMGIKE